MMCYGIPLKKRKKGGAAAPKGKEEGTQRGIYEKDKRGKKRKEEERRGKKRKKEERRGKKRREEERGTDRPREDKKQECTTQRKEGRIGHQRTKNKNARHHH